MTVTHGKTVCFQLTDKAKERKASEKERTEDNTGSVLPDLCISSRWALGIIIPSRQSTDSSLLVIVLLLWSKDAGNWRFIVDCYHRAGIFFVCIHYLRWKVFSHSEIHKHIISLFGLYFLYSLNHQLFGIKRGWGSYCNWLFFFKSREVCNFSMVMIENSDMQNTFRRDQENLKVSEFKEVIVFILLL